MVFPFLPSIFFKDHMILKAKAGCGMRTFTEGSVVAALHLFIIIKTFVPHPNTAPCTGSPHITASPSAPIILTLNHTGSPNLPELPHTLPPTPPAHVVLGPPPAALPSDPCTGLSTVAPCAATQGSARQNALGILCTFIDSFLSSTPDGSLS